MATTTKATITSSPRTIRTAAGDQLFVYATIATGDRYAICRAEGDTEILAFLEGQEVEISIDENDRAELALVHQKQMGFEIVPTVQAAPESQRSLDIKEYIEGLGKLYGCCYKTADKQLKGTGLDKPEIKDVATTLFV
jgi:hypothetical protein